MSFFQRIASGIKDGISSLSNGGETPRKLEGSQRGSLQKQSSRGRRPTTASLNFLESHTRDAIALFVQDKFEKGEAKPHVFTQFWLQFPKLEAGFEVLRRQLEARTGSREGPLPLAVLQFSPQGFGLDDSSTIVQDLCSKALSHKCTDIDFVGLVMLLLVVHLTEPPASSGPLHPDVRTMLSCLELAFTHFNSARKGKLDKREVGEALQYEAAKAHTREGRSGRTSNRLAHRLFEGLDWEYDNTISFENFLRGILQLVQDEFGEESDMEADAAGSTSPSASRPTTSQQRRCGSTRVEQSELPSHLDAKARPRSASATGSASSPEVSRRSGSFMAALKAALRSNPEAAAQQEQEQQERGQQDKEKLAEDQREGAVKGSAKPAGAVA